MKKKLLIICFSILITVVIIPPCYAKWLIFHKPAFKGRIIDAETKEPIEGVVVVAMYNKYPLISGPGGGSSSNVGIRETLTDQKGNFYIPSYTTLIQPLSYEFFTEFIVYKPGYTHFPEYFINPITYYLPVELENHFINKIGTTGKIQSLRPVEGKINKTKLQTITVTYGIVELKELNTWEERKKALPSTPDFKPKNWPILDQMIKEEGQWLKLIKETTKSETYRRDIGVTKAIRVNPSTVPKKATGTDKVK